MNPPTFQEQYCERNSCPKDRFARWVFWHCLYRHAVPLAPLILLLNYDYFVSDRDLIASAGRATDMHHLRNEVRDFFWDSNNRGWLRRTCRIRVSGQRLKNLAHRYLPEGEPDPASGTGKSP